MSLIARLFPPAHGWMIYVALGLSAIACVLIFFVLQALPGRARKAVIAGCTFFAGLFYAVEWFLPVEKTNNQNLLTFAVPTVANVQNVLVAFTLGLGVFSLIRIHGTIVMKAKPGWENSLVLIGGLITMAVAGLKYEHGMFFRSMFRDVLNSFDAALFAMLAFYIMSAAYRAFRIRSVEATLLMGSALVVMLGTIPIGQAITSFLPERGSYASLFRLDNISTWMLFYVNGPAQRAINFGLGIGLLAIGLRVWLSLERGAFFEAKVDEVEEVA
jgi:hypothetical protein